MNKRFNFYCLLLACAMVTTSFAGTVKSRGTSGASQLSVPVGARGVALNGANLATVSGVEALYYNPAGAAVFGQAVEAQFSNMSYIADINVNYAAFVAKVGRSSFGVSVKSFDFGDILRTTAQNTEGTGETFSPRYMTIAGTWARGFTDRISFGVNFKLVSESIMRTSAAGVAADMGVQYNFATLPLRLGVVLKNLGSKMQYLGSDLEHKLRPQDAQEGTLDESFQAVSEGFEMPAELNISVAYQVIPGLSLLGGFQNNSFSTNEMRVGGEYTLSLGTAAIWAGGAVSSGLVEDDKPDGVSNSNWDEYSGSIFGVTFGAGVSLPLGNMNVDFGFGQRAVVDYFDNNTVWSLKVSF